MRRPLAQTAAILLCIVLIPLAAATAQEDARTKRLRLLCAQLSGDLTDPGGLAAFRRCLTQDPLREIKRDNGIADKPSPPPDRPDAVPPAGFGHYSRHALAEGVERFQTNDGKVFFGVDRDGRLWRWTADAKDARAVAEGIEAFQVLADGTRFLLGKDGGLWRESDRLPQRVAIDQKVAAFQAIDADTVYVRSADGGLWRVGAGARTLIDQRVAGFQATAGSVVYVLGSDGKLWREVGDSSKRSLVASDIAAFQYIADGDAHYVLTREGTLWRQRASEKPEQVDTAVAGFQAADMYLVYVVGKDGRLWQELGTREHAVLVDGPLLTSAGSAALQVKDAEHLYVLGNDHRLWAEAMPSAR